MKHVVMGTAGHVDHGKTTLVKRLTGIDTDRLEEEKRRGMTIELGFAPLKLSSGTTVSIVDVPGHEKFVKTMVAGVTGIDFVLLVIAADEGVMPQTREHIDILSLLNVKKGVVALTKKDLVGEDWLEMVREDVLLVLREAGLESMPIIPVSSMTGEGTDQLLDKIEKLSAEVSQNESSELFRLPVDRVFSITGHGTVVTGTISGGYIEKGSQVDILPEKISAKVRGIQVHGKAVEKAEAGDRCALNLAGIEKSQVEKGDVIALPGLINPSKLVDAVLFTINGKENVKHNQRVHVNLGTKEVLGRIRILGDEEIPEGNKGYVQLKFEEPVIALRGDRFIIRSYSPVNTIGGGIVLLHAVPNRSRFTGSKEVLMLEENGGKDDLIGHILDISNKMLSANDLWLSVLAGKEKIAKALDELTRSGRAIYFASINKYLETNVFNRYLENIGEEFERLYKKYPFRFQLGKEEIKSRLFESFDNKEFEALLTSYINSGMLVVKNNMIMQTGTGVIERIEKEPEVLTLVKVLLKEELQLLKLEQLSCIINVEPDTCGDIIRFLIFTEKITDLGDGQFIHNVVLKNSVRKVMKIIDEKGVTTAAEVRDLLDTGRKNAIVVMEYLDSMGITLRVGDIRKQGPNYSHFRM